MRPRARHVWVTAFVVTALSPAVVRAFSPERQLLGPEVVTVTGLLATVLVVLAVVLPSRLRCLTRALGIEAILTNHRALGMAAALTTLAHVAAVLANDPRGVGLLLPFLGPLNDNAVAPSPLFAPLSTPPARAMAGTLAFACLVALGLNPPGKAARFERWRAGHLLLGLGVLVGTAVHLVLIGHLIPTLALTGLLRGDPMGLMLVLDAVTDPLGLGLLVLLALTVLGVTARRWVLGYGQVPYRVERQVDLGDDVTGLRLAPTRRVLHFRPGQFAWLRLTANPLRAEEHPFTSCASASDPSVEFAIRNTGDWTARLRRLRPGDKVYLDGPHGNLVPDPRSPRELVLITAGIGITPAMSIVRTAVEDRWTRRIRLILADHPDTALYRRELRRLTRWCDLHLYECGGARLRVVLPALLEHAAEREYYICGPSRLIEDAVATLATLDVPRGRVHTEQFDL